MILVVGGQLDPNIGCLLRRILQRAVSFRDLLVGPELVPAIRIDPVAGTLRVNGEELSPTACFIRHDVFLPQKTGEGADHSAALNWFYALRGWALARSEVRIFNRHSYLSENNKIENLRVALKFGLRVPETVVTNEFDTEFIGDWIQKPVAGGEFTTTLRDLVEKERPQVRTYPRFVQRLMRRPELRVYCIGTNLFGFELSSPDLDYRTKQDVKIEPVHVPDDVAAGVLAVCHHLGLDFAAADFMRNVEGELHFLEINSQPMFVAFDRALDGAISDAIINTLTGAS